MQSEISFGLKPLVRGLRLAVLSAGVVTPAFIALSVHAETATQVSAPTAKTKTQEESRTDQPQGESVLDTVKVTATKEKPSPYAAKKISIGKSKQTLRETPQSVSVMTRQRLDDQNITSLEDAMKNVTGVTVQRFDAAGTYSVFNARGYGSDTYQIDGVTLRTDTNGSYLDLAVFDRIEVQRGAAGMFSGAGEPGVSFNMLRKRALAPFKVEALLSGGSWNNYRADVDVTGKLTESGNVRGRLVAAGQDYDTYMKNIDGDKKLIYGTLEFDLSDRSTLSVGGTYQDINTVLSRGLPTWADGRLIDLPVSTSLVLDWPKQNLKTTEIFAELEHHLDNDGLFKVSVRQRERGNKASYVDIAVPKPNGLMSPLTASAFDRTDKDTSVDMFFNTPFQFAGQTHNFLVGADYLKGKSDTNYAPYSIPVGKANIFAFDSSSIPEPVFNLNTNVSKTELESYGVYSQVRIKLIDMLTLIGGGRLSWWRSVSSNPLTNAVTSDYDARAEFTPYAGVVLDLNSEVSLYSSYSEIFKPQNNKTFTNEQIEPRVGNQVEVGIKGEFLAGRLNTSAAIFQIQDENRAISDPNHEGFSLASGKARSRGFETEASGQLTPNWKLSAGYAYTSTEYLQGSGAQSGQTFSTFTPKHNLNFWTHYQLPESIVRGLEVGGGVRAVSDFYSQSGAIRVAADGYTIASLQLAYQLDRHYKLSLNVDNLFDKKYYEKVSGTSRQNFYGAPRSAMLTLRAKF